MSRLIIGEALSARLHAAEAAIDQALAETASLAAALPSARMEAALAVTVGQKAFEETACSLGALTSARGHLARAHGTLAALARRLDLQILAVGQLDKPGDRPPVGRAGDSPVEGILVNNSFEERANKILPEQATLC